MMMTSPSSLQKVNLVNPLKKKVGMIYYAYVYMK